jgi:hypothetical protein
MSLLGTRSSVFDHRDASQTASVRIGVTVFVALLVILATGSSFTVRAQRGKSFQGEWEWAVYAKSRDELPPAYRNEPLKDVPGASISLTIKQRGNKLTGEYSASGRFLAKLEDGEFDSIVKGNAAKLELVSGFEGTVTVLLTLAGNRLHWKTIKSKGESYFPDDVFLRRVVRRKKRR